MDIPNIFKNRTGTIQLSDLDDNFNALKVFVNTHEIQIATLQQGQAELVNAINNFSAIPYGCIVMWSGAVNNIPTGWRLCDGTNSTPDLRDKFVIGARSDSGGSATTTVTGVDSKTGGQKDAALVNHTHPVTTSVSVSNDSHIISGSFITSDSGMYGESGPFSNGGGASETVRLSSLGSSFKDFENRRVNFYDNNTHNHAVNVTVGITAQGDVGTNKNLPPYYSLAFIMKV